MNLDAAMFYYELGFCVIPTEPKSAQPVFTFNDLIKTGRRFTKAEIENWYRQRPDMNIQILLGKLSGYLYALDFESEKGYKLFIERNPKYKDNPTVKTARGYHVYFRKPRKELPSKIEFDIDGEPAEILGSGHLITVPPSIHRKSGMRYRFINKFEKGR